MKTGELYSMKRNSREDILPFTICFAQVFNSKEWKNKEIVAKGGYQTNLRKKIENDKKVVDEQFNKIGNSFVSLDAFLANLESLEGVFETVRASLKRGDNFGDVKKVSEADKILEDLGCVEVITRQESGNDYYKALARQIDQIFADVLPKFGGAMSLIDVYLYYNRLRGSEVLTTHELIGVMTELNQLKLRVEMRQLPGDLCILQLRT